MMTIAFVSFAAALALDAPAADRPDATHEVVSRPVRIVDLNLFNADDRRKLDYRIRSAARYVCQNDDGTRLWMDVRCYRNAVSSGFRQRNTLFAKLGVTSVTRTAER